MPRFENGSTVWGLFIRLSRYEVIPALDSGTDRRGDYPYAEQVWLEGEVCQSHWGDHWFVLNTKYDGAFSFDRRRVTEEFVHDGPVKPEDPPVVTDTRIKPARGEFIYMEMVGRGQLRIPRWAIDYDARDDYPSLGWVRCTVVYAGSGAFDCEEPRINRRPPRRYTVHYATPEQLAAREGSYRSSPPPDFDCAAPASFWCSHKAHRSDTQARHRAAATGFIGSSGLSNSYLGDIRPMCDECWSGFHQSIREYQKAEKERTKLYGYHDNEPLQRGFFASPKEIAPSRFFGVELEMQVEGESGYSSDDCCDRDEDGDSCGQCEYCNGEGEPDFSNHWYQKSALQDRCQAATDSSISSGYEIISSPMTLREHTRYWSADERKRALRYYDQDRTCGMHVHVNRSSLSDLTICKMQEFLADPENAKFVEYVAGRKPNDYCFKPNKRSFVALDESRYCALNVSNADTVEFRLFAGTASHTRIISNIEFCAALVEFCESTSIGDLDDMSFRFWLRKQVKSGHRYRSLHTLISKGY